MNIYEENGYESRKHYLKCLAEEYDVPVKEVFAIASILGSEEDFDLLPINLEDAHLMGGG